MLGRSCLFRAVSHLAYRNSIHSLVVGPVGTCGYFMPAIRAASTSASAGSKMNTSKRGKFKLRPGKHDPELKDVLRQFVKRVCLLALVFLRLCELHHGLAPTTLCARMTRNCDSHDDNILYLRSCCIKRMLHPSSVERVAKYAVAMLSSRCTLICLGITQS